MSIKLRLEKDKILKNSVRYSASKQALLEHGVVKKPFTIYVPNEMVPENPPTAIYITLEV